MHYNCCKVSKHEISAENLVSIALLPLWSPMVVLSDQSNVLLSSLNLDYDATAALRKSSERNWSLILEIVLKRKMMRSVIEYIAPSGLLVVVSWVTLFGP